MNGKKIYDSFHIILEEKVSIDNTMEWIQIFIEILVGKNEVLSSICWHRKTFLTSWPTGKQRLPSD